MTILKRRPGYVKAFKKFNPKVVAAFTDVDVERLLEDVDIIRHRGKIESTINNAGAVLALKKNGSSLNELLWSFVDNVPMQRDWKRDPEIPASTPEADAHEQGIEEAGLSLRRTDDVLFAHAGRRSRERPRSQVLPLRRGSKNSVNRARFRSCGNARVLSELRDPSIPPRDQRGSIATVGRPLA